MLIPGQRYEATVLETRHGIDRAGYAALKVKVKVLDIEGDQELWGAIYTSPKAVGMGRKQFQAIGFNPDTQQLEEIGRGISLAGNPVKDGVEVEEYNGTLKVRCFGMVGGASKKALQAATAALRAAKHGQEPSVESFDAAVEGDRSAADAPPSESDDGFPF